MALVNLEARVLQNLRNSSTEATSDNFPVSGGVGGSFIGWFGGVLLTEIGTFCPDVIMSFVRGVVINVAWCQMM